MHYAIWGIARTLGLVGKNEKFEATDVKVALEIFNHLVNQEANLKVSFLLVFLIKVFHIDTLT